MQNGNRGQTIGDGMVAVSFSQVNNDTCTWKIKNTGSADNPTLQKNDKDVLPYPLRRGEEVGGLTVYPAHTHRCPDSLDVLKLEREAQ